MVARGEHVTLAPEKVQLAIDGEDASVDVDDRGRVVQAIALTFNEASHDRHAEFGGNRGPGREAGPGLVDRLGQRP